MIDPALAKSIRFVGIDVDGVLSEGGIFLGAVGGTPLEFKRYDIQDGMGLYLLKLAGVHAAIFTGRESESVRLRALELDIECHQDRHARKLPAFRKMCAARNVDLRHAAFIGDDLPDLGIMREVGLPVAVGNAVPEVSAAAKLRLARNGGHGAVREFVELFLKARGEWDDLVERYVASRARPVEAGT